MRLFLNNRKLWYFVIFLLLMFITGIIIIYLAFPSFIRDKKAKEIPLIPDDRKAKTKVTVPMYQAIIYNDFDITKYNLGGFVLVKYVGCRYIANSLISLNQISV